jgi:hypothetical protein
LLFVVVDVLNRALDRKKSVLITVNLLRKTLRLYV